MEEVRLDRRVVRTRRHLMEALEQLLETHSLSQVTVSALARAADIDRKTFYAHFSSVDALVDAYVDEQIKHILDAVRVHDPEAALHAIVKEINRLLQSFLERPHAGLSNLPIDELLARARLPLEREIRKRFATAVKLKQTSDDELNFHITFLLGGLISCYRAWANDESSMSLDELSALIEWMCLRAGKL